VTRTADGHHLQDQKVNQRSMSPGRFTQRGLNARCRCSGDRENVLGVGLLRCVCSAAREALERPRGRRGAGHIVSPRAQLVEDNLTFV